MKNLIKSVAFFTLLTLASCSKNFVYLRDMEMGKSYPIQDRHEAVIHRDDRLSITVSCKSPELAIPFNIYNGSYQVSREGGVSANATSSANEKGYRVDRNGNINFPILGEIYVEGKTVNEATRLIEQMIEEGDYIKDPLVTIEFINFKYTVLGAVGSPGVKTVKGDRITLLEAIAQAGDLAPKSRANKVAVIREIGDNRQMFMHDLGSKDIFESPCFYLQQNDVVYVEPKYKKKDAGDKTLQIISTLATITSAVATLLVLILRK